MGELVPASEFLQKEVEALRGNTFGIVSSNGTFEEKLIRLVHLIPMSVEIVDEARATIKRLREENDMLKKKIDREELLRVITEDIMNREDGAGSDLTYVLAQDRDDTWLDLEGSLDVRALTNTVADFFEKAQS